MKTLQEYIDLLKSNADFLSERFGISYLRIFGSVAREQHHEGSDVDIFVVMPPVFYNYCEAADFLEELLGCKVDLVSNHKNLRPFFKQQIEKYGIDVFGAA
ncbi:MAG: nucleotidyltransferase family protein [bacterium]|nr:nucleotidyltransferase family protein [Candidatus Limimorpha equi]